MLELPGPPLNQSARGAVSGFLRDSKNQNLEEHYVVNTLTETKKEVPDALSGSQITVSRSLIYAGGGFCECFFSELKHI